MNSIRIWDLPTRLFHLGLAGSVCGALITQYIGGDALIWHARCGYAALNLVLFRLGWGLFGSHYARFSTMLHSPRTIVRYVQGKLNKPGRPWAGHNPLGALSVVAMLLTVLAQALTGLLANDDIAFEGPLAKYVDKPWSDFITWVHADITGKAIYALIGLHLAAMVYYRIKQRINLVPPMVTGDIHWPDTGEKPLPAVDTSRLRVGGLIYFASCMLVVTVVTQL